ncbi:CHAT domain-containing protein [Candidatus Marinimicrobia bacterium]|nr:CHAT domain-containing protein [Candidatus Neomarinimicrobiota bacterium]
MKKFFLLIIFLSTVSSQEFFNHKYEYRIQKEIDNIAYTLYDIVTDTDNSNYLTHCLDIIDKIKQLEKTTNSAKSKQKLNGVVIVLKLIILNNLTYFDDYKQDHVDFGYGLYDDIMRYDYISIISGENDPNLDIIIFQISDSDSGFYNRFFLRDEVLKKIGYLETVENESKIINKRFALYKEVFKSDNYQYNNKILNSINVSSGEGNQYLSFQLGFNELVSSSIIASVGVSEISEEFSKIDLEEIFYFYNQTSSDIYDFFDGEYNIQDFIGDDLSSQQRIDKFGLPPLEGYSNLTADEFLQNYTISKFNLYATLAVIFTHSLIDQDKARLFFEKALALLSRPEISFEDIAMNDYREENLDLRLLNRVNLSMSIGKLLYVRTYQSIDYSTSEFLVDMAKEFRMSCKKNTKCYDIQPQNTEYYWHLDYLSTMIGFDEEMMKIVKIQEEMNVHLNKNDRYRELLYEKPSEDWTEEDGSFFSKVMDDYINKNIPKIDDIIQNFIVHLEGKKLPSWFYTQLKENFTFQVAQVYTSFFDTQKNISTSADKIALDMIKKYPKRAAFVNEYFRNGLIKFQVLINEEEKDTSTEYYSEELSEYSNHLYEVLNKGFNDVFEDIKIKDIQEKPSLFSQEILLALQQNWNTEAEDFDSLMKQIVRYDKISNILSVQNSEQSFLDYYNVSKEQVDNIQSELVSGTSDIITFRLRDTGSGIEDLLVIDVIRFTENLKDEELTNISLHHLEVEILGSDIELEHFFYGTNMGEDSSLNPIGEKILLFQQALNQNNESEIHRSGYFFYKWLFEGIEERMTELEVTLSDHILIIADPALKNIPFEALHNNESFLMEKYNILYENSFEAYYQDITNFNEKFDVKEDYYIEDFLKDYKHKVVAIGNIDYNEINKSNFLTTRNMTLNKLEWSKNELSAIKSVFGYSNTKIMSERFATESFIKNYNFSDVDILHLSTHGIVDSQDYKNSSIVLYPDKKNNGLLNFKEIEMLDLTNLELVFLSACDTNKGEGFKNIDLLSLQKAFNIAGTKHVIATLWQIEDKPASLFSEMFYTYFKANPLDVGYALAETKINFINTYPEYDSPHYWAAFVVY